LNKALKITFILFAALGLLAFMSGCSADLEGQDKAKGKSRPETRSPNGKKMLGDWSGQAEMVPVEASKPWRADLASYVFGNTHIEALREVEIVARVDGLLERLAVEEGDRVNQGQVLAELDKTELRLAQKEAAAKLENNRSIYERSLQMLEKELTSQEALERSKYDYETARTQLDRADLNLRYATITAPLNGIITQRMVEKGDLIRANTVLFKLADTEKLLARVYVPEKELGRIAVGSPARIQSEMYSGEQFSGVVDMIAPVVDPTTGTVKVTARITEGREKLKPGMFCSVYILIATHSDVLVISRKALIPDTESPEVFVVDDSSVVHRRKLTLGLVQGDTLEVLKGLTEDEVVVLVGQETLHEGATVRIMSREENTGPLEAPAVQPRTYKPGTRER